MVFNLLSFLNESNRYYEILQQLGEKLAIYNITLDQEETSEKSNLDKISLEIDMLFDHIGKFQKEIHKIIQKPNLVLVKEQKGLQ